MPEPKLRPPEVAKTSTTEPVGLESSPPSEPFGSSTEFELPAFLLVEPPTEPSAPIERLEPSKPQPLELPTNRDEMRSNAQNAQMIPPDRPPLTDQDNTLSSTTTLKTPTEPPPEEPSQASINNWIRLQIEQAFERIIALEKAMSAVIHANEPSPPPSLESIEQALLEDVARYDRGELTNEE